MSSIITAIRAIRQRSDRTGLVLFLAIAAGAPLTSPAHAYNHPEIHWRSVPTEHFLINYYDETEPAVYAVWKIAESAYEHLATLYDYHPRSKINLSIAAYDDESNGLAAWTKPAIVIWLPDARFDLRGNTTWLRNVISHELAHIMSLAKGSGIQTLDWSHEARYRSPTTELAYTALFPRTALPSPWLAEGTAQLGARHLGGDCWDSRRDMALRCAALSGKLLTLDEMHHFTHDSRGNEMVYNQGFSLAAFLATHVGDTGIARYWNLARQRRHRRITFAAYLHDKHGLRLDRLYEQWRDSVTAAAKARVPRNPTTPVATSGRGTFNLLPRHANATGYRGWLTSHKDDGGRTDLLIVDPATDTIVHRIPHALTSWDFDRTGTSVYYLKSRRPDAHGSYLNDLFARDLRTGREKRLTHAARIYDIAVAPSGRQACCIRYERGVYSLGLLSLENGSFHPLIEGTFGRPFLTTSFAPHSADTLVVSRLSAGKAGLYRVVVSDTTIEPLVVSDAQEESPYWADDGRIYFSADYDGIFDIYSVRPDGGDLQRHTRTVGGLFSPQLIDTNLALASSYAAEGFRIVTVTIHSESPPDSFARACHIAPLPRPPGTVKLHSTPYRPTLLRPVWEGISGTVFTDVAGSFPGMVAGDSLDAFFRRIATSAWGGVRLARSDALDKHTMIAGLVAAVETGYTQMPSDTTTSTNAPAIPPIPHPRHRLSSGDDTRGLAAARRRRHLRNADLLRLSSRQSTPLPADTTTPDSFVTTIPLLQGFYAFQSRRHAPTLGVESTIAKGLLYPLTLFTALPYAEWQVARDVHVGVLADMMAVVFDTQIAGGMVASAMIRYLRTGYLNEDIAYNLRDISFVEGSAGPGFAPVIVLTENTAFGTTEGSYDTTAVIGGFIDVSVGGLHSFPIARYSSLSLELAGSLTRYATSVVDPAAVLDEPSSRFIELSAATRFTFPILRNINRGRIYLDNLYGALFYQGGFYCTGQALRSSAFSAPGDPDTDPAAVRVRHRAGMSLTMGTIKRYLFRRTLRTDVAWDFVTRTLMVKLLYTL